MSNRENAEMVVARLEQIIAGSACQYSKDLAAEALVCAQALKFTARQPKPADPAAQPD